MEGDDDDDGDGRVNAHTPYLDNIFAASIGHFLLLDGDGHTSLSLFICSGIVTVMSSHVVMYSVSGARSMSDDEVATWADLEDDWICRGVSGVIERK